MSEYPNLYKMKSVQGHSQAIGEFLEWLEGKGIVLARYQGSSSDWADDRLVPLRESTE